MEVPGRKTKEIEDHNNEQSEEISQFLCQPCDEDGQQLPIAGFCVDCCEYLCEECFKVHRRARPSRNHILQDKATMPRKKTHRKASNMNGDICNEHKDEVIKFHCRSHNHFGCATCIAVDHQKCEGVIYVEKEYEELSKKLTDVKEQIVGNEINIEENVKCIEQYYSDAIVNIGQFRKEINDLLDKLEHDITEKAKTIKDDDQAMMTALSTKLDDRRSEIISTIAEINALHQLQRNRKIFGVIDKTENEVTILENTLAQMQNENATRRYVFEPSKQLKELLDTLKSFGNLCVMNRSSDDTSTPPITAGECQTSQTKKQQHQQHQQHQQQIGTPQTESATDSKWTQTESATDSKLTQTEYSVDSKSTQTQACQYTRPDRLRVATLTSELNVKTYNDKTDAYFINGMALLPGNQLVILDFNNRKVKLINTIQNTVSDEIRLWSSPWGVTMINDSQVAVTVPFQRIIKLLSVESHHMFEYRDIKVNGSCYGITHHDGTFIVTMLEKLEIINMNGDVLKSVVNDASGTKLFTQAQHIAINPEKTAVYVSDQAKNSVTCMSLDGKVRAVYMDDNLEQPNGLVADRHGTVYVCGIKFNNIHQITAGCTKIQILLGQQHGNLDTYSITYCDKEDRLYVASGNVKTFQLE